MRSFAGVATLAIVMLVGGPLAAEDAGEALATVVVAPPAAAPVAAPEVAPPPSSSSWCTNMVTPPPKSWFTAGRGTGSRPLRVGDRGVSWPPPDPISQVATA